MMKLSQAIETEYRGELTFHTQDQGCNPRHLVESDFDVEHSFDETFDLSDDLERQQRVETARLRREAEDDRLRQALIELDGQD